MTARLSLIVAAIIVVRSASAQSVDVIRPEQRQKARQAVVKAQEKRAKQASIIEFRGEHAFDEKALRLALKEEIDRKSTRLNSSH